MISTSIFFGTLLAIAANEPVHCYQLTLSPSPATEKGAPARHERWCYQQVLEPAKGLYVFNADKKQVRPELAILVGTDGLRTHGSLHAGKVTIHSLRGGAFNPLAIPLAEPLGRLSEAQPLSAELAESAASVLGQLAAARSSAAAPIVLAPGRFTAEVSQKPWRGFWWPNKGMPIAGPLGKYEKYVQARTDASPGVLQWESANHVDHGVWWEGHCNGWAASSIMRPEPSAPFQDDASGQSFSVSDLKGLLAEDDYCANAAMWGNRFDGTGVNPNPVNPVEFHNTLTYYIGSLKKPVAMNYRPDDVIDNHVISGYTFDVQRTGPSAFAVTATLRMHRYDAIRTDYPGIAPSYTRVYRYTLTTDRSGNAVAGQWQGGNPGFLWVPLSYGRCDYGNPNLEEDFVKAITESAAPNP